MANTSQKKSYYRFFTMFLLFAIFIVALDYTVGNILRHYYFKQSSGMQYRTTYSMEKSNEDILVFGSSRASHHYIPAVFEKELGQSSYNAGRDGQMIFYHYAVLQSVLKRYTPKIIILDFHNSDLQKDLRGYDRLSALLPYYKDHPEIREMAELKGQFEKVKLISSIYPFNSSVVTILAGNTDGNKKRREEEKGYLPIDRVWNKPLETEIKEGEFGIDSVKKSVFELFIKKCQQKNIALFIIKSPAYFKYIKDPYVAEGEKIAHKYNVNFWDYSNDSLFLNRDSLYFGDPSHMNRKGAKVFSEMIANKIQSLKPESVLNRYKLTAGRK